MKKNALITGASGGIGYEFVKLLARDGYDLFLVARNETKLKEIQKDLESQYDIHVTVMVKDLSEPNAAQAVVHELGRDVAIDVLINNAGFGNFGMFAETDWKKESSMIQLNITALTHLTKLLVPGMKERGVGRILNVASTAAFQPGPLMAVYYATKAYVLSFSEAIANELKGSGVTVTALCPGATASNFQKASAMEKSALVKDKKLPSAAVVAKTGYEALMKGKTVVIHGQYNKFLAFIVRLFPRNVVTQLVRRAQSE